jgi:hypothetical protein
VKRSVNMAVDLGAFNSMIAGLEQDVQDAVRPAAQAGAEVFYRAVLQNVNALGRKTGNLAGAIYQAYSPDNSGRAARPITCPGTHARRRTAAWWSSGTSSATRCTWPRTASSTRLCAPRCGASRSRGAAPRRPRRTPTTCARGRAQAGRRAAVHAPAFYKQGEAFAAVRAKFFEVLEASK